MDTDKKNLYIISGVVAILLILTIVAVSFSKKDDTTKSEQSTNQPLPTTANSAEIAPTAAIKSVTQEHEIGDIKLKLGSVSGVSGTPFTSVADNIGAPAEGKAYLVINMEIRYTGNTNKYADSTYASLSDASNASVVFAQPDIYNDPAQPYTGTILYRDLLDSTNNQVTKNLVFAVNKDTQKLRFEYKDTQSNASRIWEFDNPVK
jgi:hypothetical protein